MDTTTSYLTSILSQHPTHERLYIQNSSTRAMVPNSVPYTSSDSDFEFHFNPVLDLSSPTNASSFMSPEIADQIATFAFEEVSRFSGLSVGEQVSEEAIADYLNDTSNLRPLPEEVEELLQSWDSTVNLEGMSEREISMLRTEQLTGDEEDECCICLEGFLEGTIITPLPQCWHRFHHGCIVKWLRNNPTCPICRSRISTVPVS